MWDLIVLIPDHFLFIYLMDFAVGLKIADPYFVPILKVSSCSLSLYWCIWDLISVYWLL